MMMLEMDIEFFIGISQTQLTEGLYCCRIPDIDVLLPSAVRGIVGGDEC